MTPEGLGAATGRAPWVPGVNVADCQHRNGTAATDARFIYEPAVGPHDPPSRDCGCGLYAWHTLTRLAVYDEQRRMNALFGGSGRELRVFGAVAGWGRVITHRDGWRAEKARVLAFAVKEDTPFMRHLGDMLKGMYGVPLVPFDMLQLEGARHAAAVPNSLLPKPKSKWPEDRWGASAHWFASAQSLAPPPSFLAWVAQTGDVKDETTEPVKEGDVLNEVMKRKTRNAALEKQEKFLRRKRNKRP